MAKSWLSYFSLSDHYERKARFLPGFLALLPAVPVLIAFGQNVDTWINIILSGVGIGAVVSVGISHVASAFGNRLQESLWPDWPHDSPTNKWLHPDDKTVSEQQKKIWYSSIKIITGLDIESAIYDQSSGDTAIIINDSVKAIRHRFWKAPEASRLDNFNVDYGFARNITGLRLIWIILSLVSTFGCWVGYVLLHCPIFWCVVSTSITLIVIPMGFLVLPNYVRKRAHYYAESFFGTLVEIADNK